MKKVFCLKQGSKLIWSMGIFSLIFHNYIEDITQRREDKNFILEW